MAEIINGKKVIDELAKPALIILGMAGGNFAGKALDKMLKVDSSLTGFNAKAAAKPVIQIATGIAGAVLLKDKNMKLVASGIAASGIASGVKVLLKKDLLAGFDGLGNDYDLDDINNLMQIEPYDPDLPELSSANFETLEIEAPQDDYEDYDEVQDVEIM